MELKNDLRVKEVFDQYPGEVKNQLLKLRELVLTTASGIDGLEKLEETLKWGEPSFLTKHGSTLRMDWKKKKPGEFALYFNCNSRLVETFKILFKDELRFEGTRAIVFHLDEEIPEKEIKHCITLALTYHKVKHLPMLGA